MSSKLLESSRQESKLSIENLNKEMLDKIATEEIKSESKIEHLKRDTMQLMQDLEIRTNESHVQLQESQKEIGEKFQRMLTESKDNLETLKLKYTNERKEVEIELREGFPETEITDNILLDMLGSFKKQFSETNENMKNLELENCKDKDLMSKELLGVTQKFEEKFDCLTQSNSTKLAENEETMR